MLLSKTHAREAWPTSARTQARTHAHALTDFRSHVALSRPRARVLVCVCVRFYRTPFYNIQIAHIEPPTLRPHVHPSSRINVTKYTQYIVTITKTTSDRGRPLEDTATHDRKTRALVHARISRNRICIEVCQYNTWSARYQLHLGWVGNANCAGFPQRIHKATYTAYNINNNNNTIHFKGGTLFRCPKFLCFSWILIIRNRLKLEDILKYTWWFFQSHLRRK